MGRLPHIRNALRLLACLGLILAVAACAGIPRPSFTADEQLSAIIPGIPHARVRADDAAGVHAVLADVGRSGIDGRPTILALSGGGADGAYGAGFLSGWTETGTRPRFTIVSGTSVGALIAPFAFLGPEYDPVLRKMFSGIETHGLLRFAGIFGAGLFQDEPLRRLIDQYVDQNLLAAVAREHQAGRRLFVVTTNIDSQRTSIWNMGEIAASGAPHALELFRSVLDASASIPGVFPPELIEVSADGRHFAEAHVDGGVTANVLIIPEALLTSPLRGLPVRPAVYVIINGKVEPSFEVTKISLMPLIERTFATTLKVNTRNALLVAKSYSERAGWDFHYTAIPSEHADTSAIDFDSEEMGALLQLGAERGRQASWENKF